MVESAIANLDNWTYRMTRRPHRRERAFLPAPKPHVARPLYLQVVDAIEKRIREGGLRVGQRLPAERQLAAELGVSRITVTNAYQELGARGLVRAHVGRGTIVVSAPAGDAETVLPWAHRASPWVDRAVQLYFGGDSQRAESIDFASGYPDPALYPIDSLAKALDAVAENASADCYGATPAPGDPMVREALAAWLGRRGIRTHPDQILVTVGAQQGLNLLARALVVPGDVVVTETPTFFGALLAFRWAGAEVVGVPGDRDGIQVDLLEEAIARHHPKFIYLIPTFQNPTGVVLGPDRRRQVIELAARFRVPVIESDLYGEIFFEAAPPLAMKALDDSGLVIYQGSFSKIAVPGLRVGWLVVPAGAMTILTAAKVAADCYNPILPQRMVAELVRTGSVDRHLKIMRKGCASRRDSLVSALREHCPTLRFRVPQGGYFLWAQLPPPLTTAAFLPGAAEAGVTVRTGAQFRPDEGRDTHLRLCFAGLPPQRIVEGSRRLGHAIEAATQRLGDQPSRNSLVSLSLA